MAIICGKILTSANIINVYLDKWRDYTFCFLKYKSDLIHRCCYTLKAEFSLFLL